jgi:hypothetical protein
MAYGCQRVRVWFWGLYTWKCPYEADAFCECFKVFCSKHLAPPAHNCDAETFNPNDPRYQRKQHRSLFP